MIVTLKTVAQTPHIVILSDSDKKALHRWILLNRVIKGKTKVETCIFEWFKEVGRTTGENLSHFSIVLNKWEVIISQKCRRIFGNFFFS